MLRGVESSEPMTMTEHGRVSRSRAERMAS